VLFELAKYFTLVHYVSMVTLRATPGTSRGPAPSTADAHAAIECLTKLAELSRHRREQLAEEVGLTDQQWEVLEEVATEHFMPSLFARRRASSPAAVSKILRQLLEKGVVVASIADNDARQRRYALTPKGRRLMDRLRERREEAVRDVWLTLDAAGMRAFTQFGNRLIERLEHYAARAAAAKE
jgi:DNA-binding MarR family transcriptional regulator